VWSAADSLTRFASLEWQQASLPEGPWAVVSRQNLPEYLPNPPASRQTYYRLLATTPAGCQALSEAVSIDRRFATPQARIHTLPAPTYRGAVVLESGDSVRFINRSSDPSTAPFNRLTLEWQGLGEPLPAVDTVVWVAPRLPSADAEVVQTLRLRVTNTAGCTDEDSAVVWVRAGCIPKLPNAFSPNADLRNDTWPASATEALALFGTTTQVQVFDRWGTLTYEYPSDGPAWLGTFRNRPDRPCPEAAYVYVARCFDRENLTLPRAGTVTLIR
jgi:gliding motility-associated-like protein